MADAVRQFDWAVAGLDCPTCAATLERACAAVPGVVRAIASPATGRLTVVADPAQFELQALHHAARRAGHPVLEEGARESLRPWLPAIAGAVLLAVGIAVEAAGLNAAALYLPAAIVGGATLPLRAWQALRQRNLDIHVLMTLALLGALGLQDWREAALLVVLFAVARALERGSLATSRRAVESLLELAPRTALLIKSDGTIVEREVEKVRVGAKIRVRPGDAVPLDGLILDGTSGLNEAAVTGESVPVTKGPGQPVFAATLAIDGALTVQVTRPSSDSTLARVVALVQEAEQRPSPLARQVDRFAAVYTPVVVVLAVLVALLPGLFGAPFGEWFYRGLVVLVLSCPCALVLATPAAVCSGLTAAARRGVLIRGGAPLEALASVTAAAFDKTGTLTRGEPRVEAIVPLDGRSETEVLALAAGLEADSTHPLATALRQAADERQVTAAPTSEHRAEPGRGVRGTIDGAEYTLGSARLIEEDGLALGSAAAPLAELAARGLTTMVLAGERPLAVFGLADALRPEAAETVSALRRRGLHPLVMLSGDRAAPARAVAESVGLHDVRAELLPEEKQAAVATLREAGGVAMLGDGINDAPALAAADVGIALGAAGSDIAIETADIALMGDDLRAVPRLIDLARRTRAVILGNIVAVIALRVLLLPLGVAGEVSLPLAVLADCGSAVLVTANSFRLLR